MFDVGFSELLVIGVVALLVIGPEKLPKVARTVGALMGRAQRYVNDVKADINREIELDELKKMHTSVTEAAQSIESSVKETMAGFESQASELGNLAKGAVTPDTPTPEALAHAEASIRDAIGPLETPAGMEPTVAAPEAAQASLALETPAPPATPKAG
jgi:sec-independent protein translocase protein TatB